MSRLAKKPITIPSGVEVKKEGVTVTVKGPKGTLTRDFTENVSIEVTPEGVLVSYEGEDLFLRALRGTYASHLINMIEGVSKGFEKKLLIEGVGYKVAMQGKKLVFDLGFSHEVELEIPEGLNVSVEKNSIAVSGQDKELVGAFSAKIRDQKRVEPYKGKGIFYEGEHIRRKQGKKTVG